MFASALFVIEILLIFLFHIYHGQWKLFFRRPYYLCLTVLAVGGMVGAIPLDGFYDPLQAGNGLAIFQVQCHHFCYFCTDSVVIFVHACDIILLF